MRGFSVCEQQPTVQSANQIHQEIVQSKVMLRIDSNLTIESARFRVACSMDIAVDLYHSPTRLTATFQRFNQYNKARAGLGRAAKHRATGIIFFKRPVQHLSGALRCSGDGSRPRWITTESASSTCLRNV